MKNLEFSLLLRAILLSSFMLVLGLYFLTRFNSLFKRVIRFEWLRKNMVVWLIAVCMILAISPTNHEFFEAAKKGSLAKVLTIQIVAITLESLFVFNTVYLMSLTKWVKRMSFRKQMMVTLATIIICTMIAGLPVNYYGNGGFFKNLDLTLLFNFYTGSMCGFVYVATSYVNLERQKILSEKELEVSRLQQLKSKAELDALQSKVNPHFLYNALNSIADLSITDGKKARQMTIALADLFRYSINYSNNNYSTVNDEVAMTEVYLQIEKIRFEDNLNYTVYVDNDAGYYLIPRFILQPLVENAVKHGLKMTGKMTEIKLEAKVEGNSLVLNISDNGPLFPDQLTPGYGVKSVFDKLDLLFPGSYEIFFRNEPHKEVSIRINKL
ncbi:MAG: histidine kinase, partial [Bacteroidota bacterium]